ncbi:hypothetical protein ACROYT_G034161 [Oculina patagonica]
MLLITSLFLVLVFGFQQFGTFAEDLGTYSSCHPDHMLVVVDLTQNPDLVVGEIHLNDVNCKETDSNGTFASFQIPLSGCGTVRDGSDPEYLIFSNTVRWYPTQAPGQLQTRQYRFESGITCKYQRNGTASVSIRPVQELTVSQTVYGQFSFSMELFRGAARQFKRDLDIPVTPTTPLHFRVQVISPDSDLVLHLSRCWARNRDFVGPAAFIDKGCDTGSDATLDYQCNPSSTIQDFSLDAFRILNSPDDFVFFLCDVIVCLKTANASICKDRCNNCIAPGQGGGGAGTRRRRAIEENGYDTGSKTYSLAIGPFSVNEKGDGKDLKNQDETDVKENQLSLQMIVVLCVTSLVAVGMVCGTIVVVIMYKRWAAKHQGIEDRNMASPPAKPRKPQVLKL